MIVNLRESKARLSELVELASAGEDVLITVRGKLKARLTKAGSHEEFDPQAWVVELLEGQERYQADETSTSTDAVLDELRDERF